MAAVGKGRRDEPAVPRHGGSRSEPSTGRPRPPLRAGSGRDGEGEPGGSSQNREKDADAAGAGRDAEPREKLREKLQLLGGDAEEWEGRSAAAAAAAELARRIAETPTPSYPGTEPGTRSGPGEPGWGGSPDLGEPVGIYGELRGMLRAGGNAGSREEEEEMEEMEEDEDEEEEEDEENEDEEEEEDEENEEEDLEKDSDSASGEAPAVAALYFCGTCTAGELAEEFPALWARSRLDCGRLAEEEMLDGDPVPFQEQPRVSPRVERHMEELLREYLREGIVEEAASRSNNPLILKKKPKGRGWWLTLDCRALNASTPVAPAARLDKEAILSSIHPRSRFFSVLDLSNACFAVPLAPECRHRFAFTFRGRQFAFTRLPPSFRGTASIVHGRVAALLARLEPGVAAGLVHYSDDILVTGKSWRQAERRTRLLLELVGRSGFKAKREKAQLMRREVNYLGVAVSAAGLRVPQEKVREIREECDAPGPWSPARLRSVLGKLGYWQKFIPDYCELALPLQRLAGPGRQPGWRWGREQRQRLRRLSEALAAAPVLPFPDRRYPFVVRLSPRAETTGATLLQEKAGSLLPVRHFSRTLSRRHFTETDRWCLAAVLAVRAFQPFTGPASVVIQDPNGNYLFREHGRGSGSPPCLVPWTLLVAPAGAEPPASPTMAIAPAPPLALLPAHVPRAHVWFLAVERGLRPQTSVGFVAASLEERHMSGVCGHGSEEDAELEALREILEQHRSRSALFLYCGRPGLAARLERWEREGGRDSSREAWAAVRGWLRASPGMLSVREVGTEPPERERMERLSAEAATLGCITRSSWIRWSLSKHERQEIVAQCHRGHEGVEQTLARAQRVEMAGVEREDVARWVLSCPTCRESDPNANANAGAAPQRAEGPWSRLRLSLSPPLPRGPEGFQALLVVQDELSGWLDAFPLRRRAAPELSRALLHEAFASFGKVQAVLLEPEPAWVWDSLRQAPLRDFWSRLERSERHPAAACVCRVAQAAGPGWAATLPLILAGARSRWAKAAELRPLLCVPAVRLELRREEPGAEAPGGNELSRLRGMRLRPALREQVEAALQPEPRWEWDTGILRVRDWGRPDPGSRYARDPRRIRRIPDWRPPCPEGAGISVRESRDWEVPFLEFGPAGIGVGEEFWRGLG